MIIGHLPNVIVFGQWRAFALMTKQRNIRDVNVVINSIHHDPKQINGWFKVCIYV